MIAKDCENIIDLINFSNQLYESQIKDLRNYCNRKKENSEKWFELLYSILVGTQIKTSKVKYCYDKLLEENYDILSPEFLIRLEDFSYLKELIQNSLEINGYRFYKTKSEVIYNVIQYFQKYNFNINNFLSEYNNYEEIREELIKINGIGLKIASHWLRNIGFYIPVIDIHIKNLLFRFKLTEKKHLSYKTYEKIQNEIINILKIDNLTFDLALWYYGKDFCGNRKCKICNFNTICQHAK